MLLDQPDAESASIATSTMSSERSSERSALIDIEKEGEDSYGTFDVNAGAAGQAIPSRMPHSRKALGEEWMSRLDDDILISAQLSLILGPSLQLRSWTFSSNWMRAFATSTSDVAYETT